MNNHEEKCKTALARAGFEVLDKGWPDICAYRLDPGRPKIIMVECKQGADKLSPEQKRMHEVLLAVGVQVHVLRPEHLADFKAQAEVLFDGVTLKAMLDEVRAIRAHLETRESLHFAMTKSRLEALEKRIERMVVLTDASPCEPLKPPPDAHPDISLVNKLCKPVSPLFDSFRSPE